MEKTFIYVSDVNENEYLLSLNRAGKNLFNTETVNSLKLAREALMFKEYELMDSLSSRCLVYSLCKEIEEYKDVNYEDSSNLFNALYSARMLIEDNEEKEFERIFSDGEFKEKNIAFLKLYRAYMSCLAQKGIDDSISLIRKAIASKSPLFDTCIVFTEYNLSPLENRLIKTLFRNIQKISYIEYFKLKETYKIEGYRSFYGFSNEMEYILNYIIENKIPYGLCNILCIDSKYLPVLGSYAKIYDIPMSFHTGTKVKESSAYKLLDLLYRWNEEEFFSYESLLRFMHSPYFDLNKLEEETGLKIKDRYLKQLADLKIGIVNHDNLNIFKEAASLKEYETIEKIAHCLTSYADIINRYTLCQNDFDNQSREYICDYLLKTEDIPLSETMDSLGNVYLKKEKYKADAINIISIDDALNCFNEYLFIMGLNASVFPGSALENYILLDSDLERLNTDNIPYSYEIIERNKKKLHDIIKIYSALNFHINLSFSEFNLNDLKEENASSILFEIYKKESLDDDIDSFNRKIEHHGFFETPLSLCQNVGLSYLNSELIDIHIEDNLKPYMKEEDLLLSPTGLERYFDCPKYFYYRYILKLKEDETDDPLQILEGSATGTMVHAVMEEYGNDRSKNKDKALKHASDIFDDYLKRRIPLNDAGVKELKTDYLNMVNNGLNSDPDNEIFASEKEIDFYCKGLHFRGFVDRIEKINDDEYIIVDYKTYSDVKNKQDDIDSCLQIILYAYGLESLGYKVKYCEYRYLNNRRNIRTYYSEDIKDKLLNKIDIFKTSLNTGDYPWAKEKDACTFCGFKKICKRKEEDG
ncbi:MAG: PD-(D/E)XK nuclease family protein, partial [Erysipelotrichaceae bacterium]